MHWMRGVGGRSTINTNLISLAMGDYAQTLDGSIVLVFYMDMCVMFSVLFCCSLSSSWFILSE